MRTSEETIEIVSRPAGPSPKAKRAKLRGLLAFWAAYFILLLWGGLGTVEIHSGILIGLTIGTVLLLFEWMPQMDRGWKVLATPEYLEIRTAKAQRWSAGMATLTGWKREPVSRLHRDSPHAEQLVFQRKDGDQFALELGNFRPDDIARLLDYLDRRADLQDG